MENTHGTVAAGAAAGAEAVEDDQWWFAELDKSILNNKLIDKILGCIYGNCLGDAVGLGNSTTTTSCSNYIHYSYLLILFIFNAAATEFLNKKQIETLYGDSPVPFPDYKLNAHNRRWKRGDWYPPCGCEDCLSGRFFILHAFSLRFFFFFFDCRTDDSDQMILILETILELDGSVDERRYASKLKVARQVSTTPHDHRNS